MLLFSKLIPTGSNPDAHRSGAVVKAWAEKGRAAVVDLPGLEAAKEGNGSRRVAFKVTGFASI